MAFLLIIWQWEQFLNRECIKLVKIQMQIFTLK